MLTSLGKYLRTFRIQRGELLKDMAEILNVAPAYLSSIENGKRVPTEKLINTIINFYNFEEEQILELKDAYFETLNEVKMNMSNATSNQKDLCFSFARKFDQLNDVEIEKIRKILEGLTE